MTIYKQGEILLVPFPFTDLSSTKQRPALVISADWFNASHQDAICVAITSHDPHLVSRDELSLPSTDLPVAGLPRPSKIKAGKVFTIHESLVVRKMGALPGSTLALVIRKFIELSQP